MKKKKCFGAALYAAMWISTCQWFVLCACVYVAVCVWRSCPWSWLFIWSALSTWSSCIGTLNWAIEWSFHWSSASSTPLETPSTSTACTTLSLWWSTVAGMRTVKHVHLQHIKTNCLNTVCHVIKSCVINTDHISRLSLNKLWCKYICRSVKVHYNGNVFLLEWSKIN